MSRAGTALRRFLLFFALFYLLPLGSYGLWSYGQGWPVTWARADWSSAGVLPSPTATSEPVVHVMGARVGRWRGIFADHLWIVVKPPGAERYTRYDVVGWGSPVRVDHRAADARWYGNLPSVLLTLRGAEAEAAIPRLRQAIAAYPFRDYGDYRAWPGPNSNTFVAHVARQVPELAPALIPTAVGKDYRDDFAGLTPSGTGVQLAAGGLLGLSVGWIEGIEINILGVIAGLDLRRPALKLPGWGRIGLPLMPDSAPAA